MLINFIYAVVVQTRHYIGMITRPVKRNKMFKKIKTQTILGIYCIFFASLPVAQARVEPSLAE